MSNFIIYGLPRSRTAWLSKFLTYKDHTCKHELALEMRTPSDYKEYFSGGNRGASETGAAQGWWLVENASPGIKTVVVHRPVDEVVSSLLDLDLGSVAYYDKDTLVKHMSYGKRVLDSISKRPDVLSIDFNDLKKLEVCKQVFEHCLPYEFDVKWWGSLKNQNIQINMRDMLKYYHTNKEEILRFKSLCKSELRRLRKEEPLNPLWYIN